MVESTKSLAPSTAQEDIVRAISCEKLPEDDLMKTNPEDIGTWKWSLQGSLTPKIA